MGRTAILNACSKSVLLPKPGIWSTNNINSNDNNNSTTWNRKFSVSIRVKLTEQVHQPKEYRQPTTIIGTSSTHDCE
uniref:Uncharacterized protein n=1 Tax=Arundo donax TaxID=35708 RepID=A0A0A9DK65_ARUDO